MKRMSLLMLAGIFFEFSCKGETVVANEPFTLASPAFIHNGFIPQKYTCDGDDISPELNWAHAPVGAQSFALIVDDPDAPGGTWVHWVIYNIPGDQTALAQGVHTGFSEGENSFTKTRKEGDMRYGGPCPPSGTHHYHFKLYALDQTLSLEPGVATSALLAAMGGHILAKAELVGLYKRKK